MQKVYCGLALLLIIASLTEVFGGSCQFKCLRQAISCKRQKRDFCCEEYKKCGAMCPNSANLDLSCNRKRGSWNKRYYNDFPISDEDVESEDLSLPYF